ncbi:hypothetical protein amrb99_63140 [Actinomadura sp. RB99]|nr:hypothetical protein [Actinomadura sp. RB99]MBD2897354.1 hypothetical protein [Actinomadura sp. RB99]
MGSFAEIHIATVDKSSTDGKSSTWPAGEPKSVRDAADRKGGK